MPMAFTILNKSCYGRRRAPTWLQGKQSFLGEGESKGIFEYDYQSCYLFCLHAGVTMEWLEILRKWKRNIDNYFT